MDLPQEDIKSKHSGKYINVILFIFLLLSVISVAFLVYLKNQNIDVRSIDVKQILHGELPVKLKEAAAENPVEIKYDIKEHPVFNTYRDWIIKCTRDSVEAFNKNGEYQWKIAVSMNDPMLKTEGPYLLVADIGGREIYVIEGKDIKRNKRMEDNIINADINSEGYVACVHEAKSYKGAVTVFNLQGGEIFTRNIAENFVFMAKVSPKADQVLINCINASGINASSSIEFTDMFGKPLAGDASMEGEVFPYAWFVNKDCIAAVGDSSMIYFDKDRHRKWKKDFTGRKIFSADMALNKYTVIALSGEDKPGVFGHKTEVEIINADEKPYAVYTLDNPVINMKAFNDLVALNTGREIHFINTRGKLVGKYTSKFEVLSVYFLNKQEAVVVTKTNATIVPISQ